MFVPDFVAECMAETHFEHMVFVPVEVMGEN